MKGRSFDRPGHRWYDSIEVDVREIGCDDVDLIQRTHSGIQWRGILSTTLDIQIV